MKNLRKSAQLDGYYYGSLSRNFLGFAVLSAIFHEENPTLHLGDCGASCLQPAEEDGPSHLDLAEVWDALDMHKLSLDRTHRRFEALKSSVVEAISAAISQLTEGSYMKSVNDNTVTLVTGVHSALRSEIKKLHLAIDKLDESQREGQRDHSALEVSGLEGASFNGGAPPASTDGGLLEAEPISCSVHGPSNLQEVDMPEPELADVDETDSLDSFPSVLSDTYSAQPQVNRFKCSVLSAGDTVLVHSLSKATDLNNLVGVIEGYHEFSERYEVRFAPRMAPSRIRACNLMHPARCPHCSGEITGSQCFACPSGNLVLHQSLRTRTPPQSVKGSSHSTHTHMDFLSAASLTPEDPGSHSGNGLQMHASNDQHEDT